MNNGDGLRVVLWLSGCSHHCYQCHNSQTWNPNSGIVFDKNARSELFKELARDYISGITITGGDPLFKDNLKEVLNLIDEIRISFPDKNVWLYSGYTWEEIFGTIVKEQNTINRQNIIKKCDVFIDGRYIDSQRDIALKWRGSKNQRLINVQESLHQEKVTLWID